MEDDYYNPAFNNRRKGISLASLTSEQAEAKKKKLQEQEEQKIVDYTKVFSEKLGDLNFPPRLKERPLTAYSRILTQSTDPVSLPSLPGNLNLDYVTTQKYFGDDARLHFYDRYRFLDRQSKITVKDKDASLEKLYFENEKPSSFELVPFGPLRDTGSVSGKDQKGTNLGFRSRFRAAATADSYAKNDSFLLSQSIRRSGEEFELDEHEILFEEELMKASQENNIKRKSETIVQSDFQAQNTMSNSRSTVVVTPVITSVQKLVRPQSAHPILQGSAENNKSLELEKHRDSVITTTGNTVTTSTSSKKSIRKPPPPPSARNTMKEIHKRKVEEMMQLQRSIAVESAELGKKKKNVLAGKSSKIKKQSIRQSRFGKSNSISPDIYSQIILEDLLTKFHLTQGGGGVDSTSNYQKPNSPFPHDKSFDDVSIASGSTVQTLDLFIQQNRENGDDLGRGEITSPRTKFLASCVQEHINPRASLVLRKNMTKRLELQHHGIGDKLATLLATSIRDLPFIESINIADNMLTDEGMGPIILAAVNIPTLTELNLSQNVIGPVSSNALHEYLISSECTLKALILNAADVDDFECSGFIDAVKQNKSLRELDLSANLIGKSENLNTVMPDIITGGEAIADLLRSPECNLTKLQLQWNMIRLDGAIDLASSLSINNTLVYLDLSFNSLSTDGGIVLGISILRNRTLQTLILSNNSIDAKACFTICAGIIENRSLRRVVLDGNPIGEQGMKALMLVPILAGNRVKISAAKCNITIKDPRCWFDFDKLIRDYDLDMEDGFERAIAIILLHLIAGHQTYIFSKFDFEAKTKYHEKLKQMSKNPPKPIAAKESPSQSKKGSRPSSAMNNKPTEKPYVPKLRPVDLIQALSDEHVQYFDEKQKDVIKSLEKIKNASSDIQNAIRLFQEFDEDGSGHLEIGELGHLMSRMGLKLSDKRLGELMNKYDVDGGGSIEMSEFLMLLKSQKQEAVLRIKEMMECPIMVLRNDKKNRYIPPESGFLHITVVDGFARKKIYRVLTTTDREYIEEMSKEMGGNVTNMVKSSLENTKLRLDEALTLAETMMMDSRDKVAIVKKLLLQMDRTDDAQHFLTSVIGGNRADMLRLKKDFGAAMRPLLGNPNGYYVLDMSKEMDRMCLERLLEISATDAANRQEASKIGHGRTGDLSQKGNYSCFRNEMFNGKPITLTLSFVSPMPTSGKLEFDFSGAGRPSRDVLVLSDQRIIKILRSHHLLDPRHAAIAMLKLQEARVQAQQTLGCNGNTHYECPMDRARVIAEHIETFYNSVNLRMKMYEDAQDKENAVETDANGKLIDCFEREKYPMPLSIADYYVRQEIKQREKEQKEAIEKAAQLEKERRMAERYAIYRGGSTVSHVHMPLQQPESSDSDDDSSDSSDGSMDPSTRETSQILKVPTNGDSDDERAAGESALDANQSQESADWLKEFELLKQAMQKKKETPKAQKQVEAPRRKNFFQDEGFVHSVVSDDFLEKFKIVLEAENVQGANKAHRIVELLEDVFSRNWIYARHLALILESFVQYGYYKQTKYFGTYRVELVIALFARVVDLHNFEFVLEVLSPFEVACVICRLGYLNLYNPCKPEGSWELDMSRREERIIAKTLCVLATHEPGDNWTFQTFRWMRTMESMPGWQLTQPWLTEEGMPMRGLVNITYFSGEGKNKNGCKPYVSFRKSLLNLVLIKEDEIVDEEVRGKPRPPVLPGDRCFNKHFSMWDTYLAPAFVDPNRKR